MGNSFGCSASGERLASAARDGDFLEAKALLEYNPRLARYSTFGVRNSPLHHSAAQGHHEVILSIFMCFFPRSSYKVKLISDVHKSCTLHVQIVSLLLESGVDINLRNFRGQVISLILF